jgi:hypothetical protein
MNWRDIELMRSVGSKVIEVEWEYFKEWARRFPDYPKEKRYGILPLGAPVSEESIIYDEDILNLRRKHLTYIATEGGDDGMKVRRFINWIEKMEGKQ